MSVAPLRLEGDGCSLTISTSGRQFPQLDDFWDGNWLNTSIALATRAMTVRVDCTLRTEEFMAFRTEIAALSAGTGASARFVTMEEWLSLRVRRAGDGFTATGLIRDHGPAGALLRLRLPGVTAGALAALEEALAQWQQVYPVVGSPGRPVELPERRARLRQGLGQPGGIEG